MSKETELKKRIRSLGRRLRPFEKQADALLTELDESMEALAQAQQLLGEDLEGKAFSRLEDLWGIMAEIRDNIREMRENITRGT